MSDRVLKLFLSTLSLVHMWALLYSKGVREKYLQENMIS